jgi:electron transfer flavoprotein beta subunit
MGGQRNMRVAVLVKQVPSTDKIKLDEKTGTMIRSGVEAELNPLDLYAVEEAVRVKEKTEGTEITVVSMGPPIAASAIREALSMGCDKGVLLSDKVFSGADTWATANALSAGLEKLGEFDLIFSGERATDGETGQVGPSVAAQLDMPALTYVSKIREIGDGRVVVERAVEGGHEVIQSSLPAMLSVVKEINEPRMPNLMGKIRAKKTEITIMTAQDVGLDASRTGLIGSPTRVVKVFYPSMSRNGTIVEGKDPEKAVEKLLQFLKDKALV